ncbi:MAG: NUDIX domain-containing protein [Pseudomonadota bacterium]
MAVWRKPKTARALLLRDDRILLADHHRYRKPTRWGLPGGHIEWGENPADTARREVLEELGVTLGELTFVDNYLYKHRWHSVYAATMPTESLRVDHSELGEVRWFSFAEIERLQRVRQLHAGYELRSLCDYLNNAHAAGTRPPHRAEA